MCNISDDYLNKVRFATRRQSEEHFDKELKDVINQCRADLIRAGTDKAVANDETDVLVLGCMRCFVRWQTGSSDDPERDREDYLMLANDLRKRGKEDAV